MSAATGTRAVLQRMDWTALRGKRLFITGATGFFGTSLLQALDELNRDGAAIEVTALSRNPDRFRAAHPGLVAAPGLSMQKGDLLSLAACDGQFDLLIHAAADTSSAQRTGDVDAYLASIEGARQTLNFAARCGVQRMLLVSSGAVYGRQSGPAPIPEKSPFPDPLDSYGNEYGEGKRSMELLAAMCGHQHNFSPVIARCFAFFGPGLPLDGEYAIGQFVRDAMAGRPVRVTGDGTPVRSYLYAADLAVWLLRMLIAGKPFQAYNVGSDQGMTLAQVAATVRDVLLPGGEVIVERRADTLAGNRSFYVPSIARASELGLAVWTSPEEGLRLWAQSLAVASG